MTITTVPKIDTANPLFGTKELGGAAKDAGAGCGKGSRFKDLWYWRSRKSSVENSKTFSKDVQPSTKSKASQSFSCTNKGDQIKGASSTYPNFFCISVTNKSKKARDVNDLRNHPLEYYDS